MLIFYLKYKNYINIFCRKIPENFEYNNVSNIMLGGTHAHIFEKIKLFKSVMLKWQMENR